LNIRARSYFAMLVGVWLVPAFYTLMNGLATWPQPEHQRLHDQSAAEVLGYRNASDIVLSGYASSKVRSALC
jgi:hypothetical protein